MRTQGGNDKHTWDDMSFADTLTILALQILLFVVRPILTCITTSPNLYDRRHQEIMTNQGGK